MDNHNYTKPWVSAWVLTRRGERAIEKWFNGAQTQGDNKMDSAQLDAAIAEKFFGWKWIAFFGTPTRSHRDYPNHARVRRFMSPGALNSQSWIEFFAKHEGTAAVGDEPLAYCYCSSGGPQMVPHYSGDESAAVSLEWEISTRGLWKEYVAALWHGISLDEPDVDTGRLSGPSCRTRCLAALAILET